MDVVKVIVKARLNVYSLSFLKISMCTSRQTLKGNQKHLQKFHVQILWKYTSPIIYALCFILYNIDTCNFLSNV